MNFSLVTTIQIPSFEVPEIETFISQIISDTNLSDLCTIKLSQLKTFACKVWFQTLI